MLPPPRSPTPCSPRSAASIRSTSTPASGSGKTHLQHAIAWEVKRRTPKASVLYLTAERFRYQFVEAVKSQDAMAFKDKFRTIDILLIDDLEFMRGEKTEQEFEHIINSLLDGGRQVVVASARPPVQLDGLNDRMRSRLQRGLITEISPMDAGCGSRCWRSGPRRSGRSIPPSSCPARWWPCSPTG
jgi:hypothetical protein